MLSMSKRSPRNGSASARPRTQRRGDRLLRLSEHAVTRIDARRCSFRRCRTPPASCRPVPAATSSRRMPVDAGRPAAARRGDTTGPSPGPAWCRPGCSSGRSRRTGRATNPCRSSGREIVLSLRTGCGGTTVVSRCSTVRWAPSECHREGFQPSEVRLWRCSGSSSTSASRGSRRTSVVDGDLPFPRARGSAEAEVNAPAEGDVAVVGAAQIAGDRGRETGPDRGRRRR